MPDFFCDGIRVAPIATIGESAFCYLKVTRIVLGDSVKRICRKAFNNMPALREIVIGDGVEVIESSAFYFCAALETVKFGKNVRDVAPAAFDCCMNLRCISVNDSIESLSFEAFTPNAFLQYFVAEKATPTFSSGAFYYGNYCFGDEEQFAAMTFGSLVDPTRVYYKTDDLTKNHWYYDEWGMPVLVKGTGDAE